MIFSNSPKKGYNEINKRHFGIYISGCFNESIIFGKIFFEPILNPFLSFGLLLIFIEQYFHSKLSKLNIFVDNLNYNNYYLI